VERIRFQYWDRQRQEWTREWSTRTTERANELPTRVRIEIELAVPGGGTEKLSTEARIALTRPLDTR
jgi:general secretion pathway protein J